MSEPGSEAPTSSVPTRSARSTERREEVVAAAARIFAERGYAAVGMRDVAEAVGIRGASLYHHFASKEDILYAICLTVTEEPNARNLPLLDAPGTPTTRLAALVRGHLDHLRARRVEHLVALHELAALTPGHRRVVDGHRRHYQRRVREVIAAGVTAGELAVADVRLAAFAVCDVLNGVSHWFHPGGELSHEAVSDGYVALVVDGMLGARRGDRR